MEQDHDPFIGPAGSAPVSSVLYALCCPAEGSQLSSCFLPILHQFPREKGQNVLQAHRSEYTETGKFDALLLCFDEDV